jgi:hypothetical protein
VLHMLHQDTTDTFPVLTWADRSAMKLWLVAACLLWEPTHPWKIERKMFRVEKFLYFSRLCPAGHGW